MFSVSECVFFGCFNWLWSRSLVSARVIMDFTFFNKGMKIPKCRGSCFSKLGSLGKRRLLFYSCVYIFQPLTGSSFCIPTAHIAKNKYTSLELGWAKTIMILLTEAQPETKKCSVTIRILIFSFLDNLIAASVNMVKIRLKVRPGLSQLVFSACCVKHLQMSSWGDHTRCGGVWAVDILL